jgi:hypothetical protein
MLQYGDWSPKTKLRKRDMQTQSRHAMVSFSRLDITDRQKSFPNVGPQYHTSTHLQFSSERS